MEKETYKCVYFNFLLNNAANVVFVFICYCFAKQQKKKNYNNNNDLWRVVYFTIQKPRVSFTYPYTHTHIYTMNNKKVQSPQKRKLNELLFTKYTTEKQRQKLKRR